MRLIHSPTLAEQVHAATQKIVQALKGEDGQTAILAIASVAGTFVGLHEDPANALENFMRVFGKVAEESSATNKAGPLKMHLSAMTVHDGGKPKK